MTITELADSTKAILSSNFDICLEDGVKRTFISKLYTKYDLNKKSCYYLDKFAFYLQEVHKISLKDYCKKHLLDKWPICPIDGEDVGYKISGIGLTLSKFHGAVNKEFSDSFRRSCNRMSLDRKGSGNPMYRKVPWNYGLDKSDDRIASVSRKHIGKKVSEITRQKHKANRLNHPLKVRHSNKHSEITKQKLRENTARLWSEGRYNRTSSIHLKVRAFLEEIGLQDLVVEEYQVKYFSLDFAFPYAKLGIECQGGFFHVDPRLYPNGPICAIQRRNWGRDKAKRKIVADQEGWIIIELWETEINDGRFKDILLSKLKEFNITHE